jgi:vitamin K-dependent gamma-carboxylase
MSLPRSVKDLMPHLEERVSGASLSVFRIFFGIFLMVDALYFWLGRYSYFPEHIVHFKYSGFASWPNLTPTTLKVSLGLLVLGGLLISLGAFVRIAAAVVVGVILHLLMQNAGFYLNHLALTALVAFVFCWVPTTRYYALRKTRSARGDATIARYEIYWVIGLFFMTYWIGGLEKLRMEWFSGDILLVNFGISARYGNKLGNLMYSSYPIWVATWATLIIEFLAPVGILFRKTRVAAVAVLSVFHIFNHLVFSIGLFSFLMLAAMVLYFDPKGPALKGIKKTIFRGTSPRSS